jgi:BioD-like phosphotransacetylase family protein
VPSPVILSRAETLGIPLLLVSTDIHRTARQVEEIEPLPTKDDINKINLFEKMVRDHVDLAVFEKEARK